MKMRVINGKYPPNIEAIDAAFHVKARRGILYCWDDAIFNPSSVIVAPALVAHESVHADRQQGNPEAWWERYIASKEFRLQEEIPAHAAEYLVASEGLGRQQRRRTLHAVAMKLSAPLYGGMITETKARFFIRAVGDGIVGDSGHIS